MTTEKTPAVESNEIPATNSVSKAEKPTTIIADLGAAIADAKASEKIHLQQHRILAVQILPIKGEEKKHVVVIRTEKGDIVRNMDSFGMDCFSCNIPKSVATTLIDGGVVTGQMSFYKKGQKYQLQDFNSAVKSGDSVAGDFAIAEKDGCRIEKFLSFRVSPENMPYLMAALREEEKLAKANTLILPAIDESNLSED